LTVRAPAAGGGFAGFSIDSASRRALRPADVRPRKPHFLRRKPNGFVMTSKFTSILREIFWTVGLQSYLSRSVARPLEPAVRCTAKETIPMSNKAFMLGLATVALASQAWAQVGPLPDIQHGTIAVHLTAIATNLGAPDYGINPPGDPTRLFVIEQKGTLLVIENGVLLPTPALDIQSRVAPPLVPATPTTSAASSASPSIPVTTIRQARATARSSPTTVNRSVHGATFPAPNGAVQNYKNVVNEWKISAADPNIVDPTSRREVVSFGKNAANHNGGTITFGPDGYAYLALGDGGNANDVGPSHIEPGGNAQNLTTPLGKMLRFDRSIRPSLHCLRIP
jgi:hypothetical protein